MAFEELGDPATDGVVVRPNVVSKFPLTDIVSAPARRRSQPHQDMKWLEWTDFEVVDTGPGITWSTGDCSRTPLAN